MTKLDDDGVVVEIDPKQLNLTLDPETERKAKPKDDDVRAEPAEREEKPAANDDAIKALRAQLESLEAENARNRETAERKSREADEALIVARNASGHAAQTQYDLVNTNIANAKARSEQIKRDLKVARETGDTDRESDLILENARMGVTLENEERRKIAIEQQHARETAKREAAARNPQPADPFEASLHGLSPKSQQWLRSHPECVTDDVMNAKVLLADKEAKRKGLAADTPDYFAYIEEKMGYRKPERDDGDEEVEVRRERKPAYSAPVSRDSVPGSTLKPHQRRLSREQVEMAEAQGMTNAQYAAWLTKVEQDGKYQNH